MRARFFETQCTTASSSSLLVCVVVHSFSASFNLFIAVIIYAILSSELCIYINTSYDVVDFKMA